MLQASNWCGDSDTPTALEQSHSLIDKSSDLISASEKATAELKLSEGRYDHAGNISTIGDDAISTRTTFDRATQVKKWLGVVEESR